MIERSNSRQRVKTLLLGLDGATMTLLSPLMAQGFLPNLNQLLANGVYAPLISTIPPFTGPAWVSIVTGVNPGRHGIYGFGVVDTETGDLSLARTGYIGSPRLWQMINAHGLSTGVVNVPLIYPPDPVDGFMLTGMLTPPGMDRFAYPPVMANLVQEALGERYRIDVNANPELHAHDTAIVAELAALLRHRERAICALLDHAEVDFLMAVLVVPDRLQHVYWGYLVPNGPDDPVYHSPQAPAFRAEIETLYGEVDAVVGRLLERIGPSCRTFIVSDHGFGRYERAIKLNNWLRHRGWLTLRSSGGMMQTFKSTLLRMPAMRRLTRKAQRSRLGRAARQSMIDWSKTQAYSGTVFQQGVFINLKGRQPCGCVEPGAAYESLRREIVAGLAEMRDPKTNRPLFERVYVREEIFSGPYVDLAPDILPVIWDGNGQLEPGFGNGSVVHYQGNLPYGCHHPKGIFVASGPGIRRGIHLSAVSVMDVTPTVLHSLGLPVPKDLDGHVIADIFEPMETSFQPARTDERSAAQVVASLKTTLEYQQPGEIEADEQEAVIEHLKGLGYL
ncbi:MAG: alkaline phosphatase family protein [Promethearchaeota archaeon]